eukprot:CAMPEP_0119333444 /NCGR_PEP_ID=MMETSP1333-20130426/85171_1 /TAXON_ID=418940 /ORGANISM="Scyphosphaera apsteinii, Strain RCC1455" /LENGTH=104 /DNA_ID=CAMNT_0007343511 /DNA_START=43 /DNA_END=354 /DNA_ORIENTATION=-
MPREVGGSSQADNHWRQRLKKEEAALDRKNVVKRPDPFARSLFPLEAGEDTPQAARERLAVCGDVNRSGITIGAGASQISKLSSRCKPSVSMETQKGHDNDNVS